MPPKLGTADEDENAVHVEREQAVHRVQGFGYHLVRCSAHTTIKQCGVLTNYKQRRDKPAI